MLTEFQLIERYFGRPSAASAGASLQPGELGIGDDCALLAGAPDHLAISTDMLVSGRHFYADVDPFALGHKSLAVNLSDLAAMGAKPRAFTLALALPQADPEWLEPFSRGLLSLAARYDCTLIGGDTTAGPLTICITVFGHVPPEQALRRDRAKVDDDIWISGTLGDARLALGVRRGEWSVADDAMPGLRQAMEQPEPRVALGLGLRGLAHAALDISDGLVGDLMHILQRSNVSALVQIDALPCSATLSSQTSTVRRQCTAAGGDDYELCFTAPGANRAGIEALGQKLGLPLTRIGKILPLANPSAVVAIEWHDAAGRRIDPTLRGFDHFDAN
jgi:thiamine-monophosphate kinase